MKIRAVYHEIQRPKSFYLISSFNFFRTLLLIWIWVQCYIWLVNWMEQKKSTSQLGNYQRQQLATIKQQVIPTKMNSLPVEIQLKWIWKGFTISCEAKACQSSKQQGLTIERLQRIRDSASSDAIHLVTIL